MLQLHQDATPMSPQPTPLQPLLIKRYASRRLYNTETSDYVTLEEIARVIREGREVRIVDLRSGDDLTRQYLLQIIAEHESRGENVLPLDVLTDLVRSYTTQAHSVVPQFLAASFQMLRDSQSQMLENFSQFPNPMSSMPGFEAFKRQQELFLKALTARWDSKTDASGDGPAAPDEAQSDGKTGPSAETESDMKDIRRQLAELQKRISKL